MKFKITTTQLVERVYEIEGETKDEALLNYYEELPDPIEEKDCDWQETGFEMEEVKQ